MSSHIPEPVHVELLPNLYKQNLPPCKDVRATSHLPSPPHLSNKLDSASSYAYGSFFSPRYTPSCHYPLILLHLSYVLAPQSCPAPPHQDLVIKYDCSGIDNPCKTEVRIPPPPPM